MTKKNLTENQIEVKLIEAERKLDDRNENLAKFLKQKQVDSNEISELKFKLEREQKSALHLSVENEQLKKKIEELQLRYCNTEKVNDDLRDKLK